MSSLLCILVTLTACGPTRYTDYQARDEDAALLSRDVSVHLATGFYRPPPTCAVVMPVAGSGTERLRRAIEESLHRHLVTKVNRVVGPVDRRRQERKLLVDLKHADDRALFVRQIRCSVLVEAKIWQSNEDFALVWSRKKLDLEIIMVRDEALLWKARHTADRADGGLPLSPISAPFAVAKASRLHGDSDAMISLVDDAVRRIVASLPDTR